MTKAHRRDPGRPRRRLVRYARTHRNRLMAAVSVVTAVIVAAIAVTNASADEAVPRGAIRAESFAQQSGVRLERTNDTGGGKNVGWLANGDWMRYSAVDLGPAGSLTTSVRVAAAVNDGGTIELRTDSLTGPVIAAIPVSATGGWQSWLTKSATQLSPGGRHDVFLAIRSNHPWDFVNVNWITFEPSSRSAPRPSVTMAPVTATPSALPTPTAAGTAATTAPPLPVTGWIPIDQTKWNAQLAAFRATTPRPRPATAKTNAEFNATCTYSHSAADDPIVFPGIKGASHVHSFIGNDQTNADTTAEDLMKLTASSCRPVADHSAYWIPTLYEHGQPAEPKQVVVYYGSQLPDKAATVTLPPGLRMISGDAKKQQPTPGLGAPGEFYCAGGPQNGKERSTDGNWPVCGNGGTLTYTLDFPDCWDGKNLDSPQHKQHVAFRAATTCPAAFPVPIPAIKFVIFYQTSGTKDGFTLASGMASSMHGDVFVAWEEDVIAQRVKDCVVQVAQCSTEGNF